MCRVGLSTFRSSSVSVEVFSSELSVSDASSSGVVKVSSVSDSESSLLISCMLGSSVSEIFSLLLSELLGCCSDVCLLVVFFFVLLLFWCAVRSSSLRFVCFCCL